MKSKTAAVALGLLGFAAILSVGPLLVTHFKDRASQPPRAVANGRVFEVSPSEKGFTATIEFSPRPGVPNVRFQMDAGRAGLIRKGPKLEQGDAVLVEFDPNQPTTARAFSIRDLWLGITYRVALGLALLVASGLLFFFGGRARQPAAGTF